MRAIPKPPEPAYWALELFTAVMIILLFTAVGITDTAWHRPIDLGWIVLLALGIRLWCRANRDALAAQITRLNERSQDSPELQKSEIIYSIEERHE
jgi:hypothetical protein